MHMLSYKYLVYSTKKQVGRLCHQMQLAKQLYEKAKEHYKQTGKTFSQFRRMNAKQKGAKATVGLMGSYACRDVPSTPLARVEQDILLKQELHEART